LNLKPQVEYLVLLFYAVAGADGVIKKSEVEAVDFELLSDWLPLTPQQLLAAWQDLLSQGVTSKMAFEKFKDYYLHHRSQFDGPLKSKLSRSCADISVAFAGNNKSELTYLAQLYFLFNQ